MTGPQTFSTGKGKQIDYDNERQLANEDYTVGWICAIVTEYVAAQAFLDTKHKNPEYQSPHDNNDYTTGEIGGHNVVIAVLPEGEYGLVSAASVARDMLHSFPNIRFGLMVGIGGGAPTPKHDIRLGDIVISAPRDGKGGVFQYDFGKTIQDRKFQQTGFLNQPPTILRTAVTGLKAQYEIDGHQLDEDISKILQRKPKLRKKYARPDASTDRLYQADAIHDDKICCGITGNINEARLVTRVVRDEEEDNPAIHYGLIASANQLMKDALIRNRLSEDEDVLCFEMEAAGLMNHFPCLVVRGICDYSDTHKNKDWQGYAAMTAAAYTRDLLRRIRPSKVEAEQKISDRIEHVIAIVSETEKNVGALRSKLNTREELDILNWLTPIDYGPQQSDFLRRREARTGQWLLDSEEYQNLLKSTQKTLFCPGIPGAGKTILTSIVVNDLESRFENDPTVGIAYIYYSFRRKDEQKIEDILSSLLKQLAQSHAQLPNSIRDLYNYHEKKRTKPSKDEIYKALETVTKTYSKIFFIIDALDECQPSSGLRELLISTLFSLQNSTQANIFATSRFIPEITNRFKNGQILEIRASEDDISVYMNGHLSHLPGFVSRDPALQNEIKTTIIKAVKGMFLLAQLHLDSLQGKRSPKAIRSAIQTIALERGNDAYDTAYKDAMDRINSQIQDRIELAQQVLSWIACTYRPLTTIELQHALAVEANDKELEKDNIPEIEDILSVCAGLVTVDEMSGIIRLVHYTTQEYFERTQNIWFPNAHLHITTTCINYLSFQIFEEGFLQSEEEFEARLQLYCLYDYAANNWGYHAYKISDYQNVICFLKRQTLVEASTQALLALKDASHEDFSQQFPQQMTGLHLAAYFGLGEAAKGLWDKYNVDARTNWNFTPLLYAAERGHEVVSRLLLENDADVEAKNVDDWTPLLCAARRGHEAVVRLLLENDANVEAKDDNNWTPLLCAAWEGHEAVVRLLLENDANVEVKDDNNWTPLLCAVWGGYEAVARLLLENSADVEAKDKEGWTPLLRAAWRGDEAIARLLLENGANIAAKDDTDKTPLLYAASGGHEAVARLLLENGADIEAKDNHSITPLSRAASGGHEAAARLLLENGADVEAKDKDGSTPLLLAAWGGYEVVAKLLLENGADVAAKDDTDKTPLLYAAWGGYEALARLLLENGANVKAKDNDGWTPLLRAACEGHKAVARLLLENGADIEAKDNHNRTPLSRAASGGHEAVVRLLLENCADVAAKDYTDGTPLLYAAWGGYEAVARLLLENGANVKAKDKDGWTPLLRAAWGGYEAVARLLLENGADVAAKDDTDKTPLLQAAWGGHEAVARLLLKCGADVEAKDNDSLTPLLYAAWRGHEAVARLLLENGADVEAKDNDGWTPLLQAAWEGHEAVAGMLLESGADVEAKDNDGWTPLLRAASEGHEAAARLLLEKGANVEAKDNDGWTPLLRAAWEGHEAVVRTLLEKDADIETVESQGRTALSCAVGQGNEAVVRLLLEEGAKVDAIDHSGQGVLQRAVFGNHMAIEDILLRHGANMPADFYGLQALFLEGEVMTK